LRKIRLVKALTIIIPIIIIIAITSAIILNLDQEKPEEEIVVQWRNSGPFAIEKHEYYLGEKIFITVHDIPKDVKGEMVFYRPIVTSEVNESSEIIKNEVMKKKYLGIEFDGNSKQNFNRYFEPKLSENNNICSIDYIIGEWKVVFEGTQYDDIDFKIINQTASWDERTWEPVC